MKTLIRFKRNLNEKEVKELKSYLNNLKGQTIIFNSNGELEFITIESRLKRFFKQCWEQLQECGNSAARARNNIY